MVKTLRSREYLVELLVLKALLQKTLSELCFVLYLPIHQVKRMCRY